MSSSESRIREVMWYDAEDCSRSVQRWLEKLGRRRLRVGVRGTDSSWDKVECRRLWNSVSAGWWSSSARYDGARPWRHLQTRTAGLKTIRYRTFSQCNWHRIVVMWSHFDDAKTKPVTNTLKILSEDCLEKDFLKTPIPGTSLSCIMW